MNEQPDFASINVGAPPPEALCTGTATIISFPQGNVAVPRFDLAADFVRLLTGSADIPMCFRALPPNASPDDFGKNIDGPLCQVWPRLEALNLEGWQLYAVVNEGGHDGESITRIRALFVDADDDPRPDQWHVAPSFMVHRDATHWHAYWPVGDCGVEEFRRAQKRLIAHYRTDPRIHDLPRIMRLPGSIHIKNPPKGDGVPRLVTIEGDGRLHRFDDLMAELPDVSVIEHALRSAPEGVKLDTPIALGRARAYLKWFAGCVGAWGEQDPADTYALAAKLKDFGVAEETCVDLLMSQLPEAERRWIQTTVGNAFKYGRNAPGCDLVSNEIDPKAPLSVARLFRWLRYDVDDQPTLHHYRGDWCAWTGSAYPEMTNDEVRADIYKFLDQCVQRVPIDDNEWKTVLVRPNITMVNNVVDALRGLSLLRHDVETPAWLDHRSHPKAKEVIATASGLLHLPTGELLAHNPAFFTLNALDFDYDPNASAPVEWLRFLDQLWPEDAESIETLRDMFGYMLGADTSLQKAFLIVGPKRSGKGTIARVLGAVIGKANVVSPTLASLGTNFGLQPLIGKRVAIVSDARLSGRSDQAVIAERVLSITGEDELTIDRKYKGAWTGQLMTRFLVLTNEIPKLTDSSGAFASRFIVLSLTESFYGKEDPGLTDRLITELPGILNWAIEGWRRLTVRRYFVQPESAKEIVGEFEDLGSPIATFIRDECVVRADKSGTLESLFQAWERWCSDQRRQHAGDKQGFAKNLRAALPYLKTRHPRDQHGRQVLTYDGISVNLDQDPFVENGLEYHS